MNDMSNHFSFKLLPENDPCTATYQRHSRADVEASVSLKKGVPRKSYRAKLRKVRVAFLKSIKRIFGIKSQDSTTFILVSKKSPSFVTPTEYNKRLSRLSMRSRRLSARMTGSNNLLSVPSVRVTAPSICRNRSHYRVHSFCGVGSPPMAEKGSVRFSHPVVSNTTVPQSTPDLLPIPEDSDFDEGGSRRASNVTDDSIPSSFPTSSQHDSGPPVIKPKALWRWSAQSVTSDGIRESYSDFKDRLDGHRSRADRQSTGNRPPSLQFIPRMGTIKLDDCKPAHTTYAVVDASEVEKHRSNALSRLEGSNPPAAESRYVLAILPKKDLPITAIRVPSDEYPSSLIPGCTSHKRSAIDRPHTIHGPAPTHLPYMAYSPSPSPHLLTDANEASTVQLSSKRRYRKHRLFESQDLLEMPKFDTDDDATANLRHSKHYRDVESGIFDDASAAPLQMHAPIPTSHATAGKQIPAKTSFLLTPSPPSLPAEVPAKTGGRNIIPRKPVAVPSKNFSKALPPLPLTEAQLTSKPVPPISMNHNGYPNMTAHPSRRFSAEARYQPRSVDSVEAKYQKEHMKKSKQPKSDSKASQGNAEPKKPAKLQKLNKKLSEQDEQKIAELNVLNDQLKKLMCA